ncbi:serine hydrolase [Planosporangium mesophilum]|nr:serine hydrolase [Planosporangium mesophilum]NJC81894.1 serine hydrolase [Planosporangium mesophilum]
MSDSVAPPADISRKGTGITRENGYDAARRRIRRAYRRQVARVGGTWHALVTMAGPDGTHLPAVDDRADQVVPAASINKLAIACAVLDKIDRGVLRLDQRVELRPEDVLDGDGIYHRQPVWGDRLTLANVLAAMLMLSDNTAVRLCGLVCTGVEVNEYLSTRGFTHTRVEPLPDDPRRMFLGTTTPHETHALLSGLVGGAMIPDGMVPGGIVPGGTVPGGIAPGGIVPGGMVSPASTRFLLDVLRGYTDGVRRTMSSTERLRTVSKYGALDDGRHEAGVMFDADGTARVIFCLFSELPGHGHNYGATHPLVEAHARLGRCMFDQLPT